MTSPEPTPAEREVRRLLSEARHTEPMPDDVAARLDEVLQQLASEAPAASGASARVTDLAARRRRRAAGLLAAAAAVVVGGVTLTQVVDPPSAMDGAVRSESGADAGAGETSLAEQAPEAASGLSEGGGVVRPAPEGTPYAVHSSRFADDVTRAGGASPAETFASGADSSAGPAAGSTDAPWSAQDYRHACGPGPYGPGRLVPVTYDGTPAVLAFREPAGDSQVVELLQCGTGTVLRTTTLPR